MKRPGLFFGLTAAVMFCVGPFLWQALASLRVEGSGALGFNAYQEVLRGGHFGRALLNSLLVASLTTAATLSIGASAAFAIAKLPFRGRALLLSAALATSMFPPIATVSPLFLAIRAVGLHDRLEVLVVPYATFALPLTLWVMTGFFRALPDELYRAARVDGCSPFGAFWRVLLPLSLPGLATTGILVFISSWNEFLYALTFTSSPERRTVPVAISLFAAEHADPWPEISAASVLVTLPLILLTLFFQRRIVAGLTAGAVKG